MGAASAAAGAAAGGGGAASFLAAPPPLSSRGGASPALLRTTTIGGKLTSSPWSSAMSAWRATSTTSRRIVRHRSLRGRSIWPSSSVSEENGSSIRWPISRMPKRAHDKAPMTGRVSVPRAPTSRNGSVDTYIVTKRDVWRE